MVDTCTVPTLIQSIDSTQVNETDKVHLLEIVDSSNYREAQAKWSGLFVGEGLFADTDFNAFAQKRDAYFSKKQHVRDFTRALQTLQVRFNTKGVIEAWIECKRLEAAKSGLAIYPYRVDETMAQFGVIWNPTYGKQPSVVTASRVTGGTVKGAAAGEVFPKKHVMASTDAFIVQWPGIKLGQPLPQVSGYVTIDNSITAPFSTDGMDTKPPRVEAGRYYHLVAESGAGYLHLMVAPGDGYGALVARRAEQHPDFDQRFVFEDAFKAPSGDPVKAGIPLWLRATRGDPYLSGAADGRVALLDATGAPDPHRLTVVAFGDDGLVRENSPVLIRAGDDYYFDAGAAGVTLVRQEAATKFRIVPAR